MQDASSDIEVTTRDVEHILVLGSLVMDAHLVGAQPYQRELAGRIIHCLPPPRCTRRNLSVGHECGVKRPDYDQMISSTLFRCWADWLGSDAIRQQSNWICAEAV
jgi:hypothetical protein